jgi:AcrR family transcriptional regulator
MFVTSDLGLRERKKRETRQLISDIATGLFAERGFDNVTVAEVARAADVSTKTVFNYFPRKEDLFLDRLPDLLTSVTHAVRTRPADSTPIGAVRDLVLTMLSEQHPLSGYANQGYTSFWRVIVDSPALQARVREFVEELEDLMAKLIAEAGGGDPHSAATRYAAASAVAAYRTVFLAAAKRIMGGADPDNVVAGLDAEYRRAFDAAEQTAASFPQS